MRVIPAPGRVIRDPRTKRLVDRVDGVECGPHDLSFVRMLERGDVVEKPPEKPAPVQAAAAPPAPPAPAPAPAKPAPETSEGA